MDNILIFSGVQRQLTYDITHYDDPSSVQGLLEYALKQLSPQNLVKLHVSSRSEYILCYLILFYSFCQMIKFMNIFKIIYSVPNENIFPCIRTENCNNVKHKFSLFCFVYNWQLDPICADLYLWNYHAVDWHTVNWSETVNCSDAQYQTITVDWVFNFGIEYVYFKEY